LFGAGAFAHTLLILLAAQKLTPALGAAKAATAAVALYVLHNVFYASFAFVGGWLGDCIDKRILLATGYLLSAAMCLCVICLPATLETLAVVFVLGGTSVALEETLEDSLCAELVSAENHGVAFGTLAMINGVGDFISSLVVGGLWTAFGTSAAFGYSGALSVAGAALVLTLRREKAS
jgi:MFS family permease